MKMKPPDKRVSDSLTKWASTSESCGRPLEETKKQVRFHLFPIWAEMRGSDGVLVPLELLEELGILFHSFWNFQNVQRIIFELLRMGICFHSTVLKVKQIHSLASVALLSKAVIVQRVALEEMFLPFKSRRTKKQRAKKDWAKLLIVFQCLFV